MYNILVKCSMGFFFRFNITEIVKDDKYVIFWKNISKLDFYTAVTTPLAEIYTKSKTAISFSIKTRWTPIKGLTNYTFTLT